MFLLAARGRFQQFYKDRSILIQWDSSKDKEKHKDLRSKKTVSCERIFEVCVQTVIIIIILKEKSQKTKFTHQLQEASPKLDKTFSKEAENPPTRRWNKRHSFFSIFCDISRDDERREQPFPINSGKILKFRLKFDWFIICPCGSLKQSKSTY